ncbi:MAG: phage tail sheath family protein [Lachnospiraceae bacterium]|nr:phage tail sheath family protein [Lachnospiraceae bacterium]
MSYLHGVAVVENPTSIAEPVTLSGGVPVIFGTAPVNQADDPDNATNQLFLCNTFDEAKAAVGYSSDYESYTLCAAMDVFFKAYGVGPIVVCNVLDPSTHVSSYSEVLTTVNGVATATKLGVCLGSLTVSNGDDSSALTEDADYTVEFDDDGYAVFTLVDASISSISLSGSILDPSAVTQTDVIGAYDSDTGAETGFELIRRVYPKFGLAPSLLLAPGWTQNAVVAQALVAKCEDISGMFRCECLIDIDSTETGATKYTDVEEAKENTGITSEHAIMLWPMIKYSGSIMYYSTMYAALAAYTDYTNDNVPGLYPSNKSLKASAVVTADGTELDLDITQANVLNAIGVVTALNLNGYVAWGNNTAAYPDVTDPKDRWIGCRRFFSWWANEFVINYLSKVDNLANYRLIQSIVDSWNVRGNALTSQGKCAGIKMVYNTEDNPVENILAGKVTFRQYLAPYTPAEYIESINEYDVSMLEAALTGGEE